MCQTQTWYDKDSERTVHDIIIISGEIWPPWQDFKALLMLTHSFASLFSHCLQRFQAHVLQTSTDMSTLSSIEVYYTFLLCTLADLS